MLTSSFFRGGAFAWNPKHWDLKQGGVPNGRLPGPVTIQVLQPPGPPAPPPPAPALLHVPTGGEEEERRARRQNPRPLPKIPPIASRGSNDTQRQSLLLSPTHSGPFSTPGPH